MADSGNKPDETTGGKKQKVKLASMSGPAEEIFVDGVGGIMARAGIVKLDLYRVIGFDREEEAEVHSISHRLVLPAAALPELLRVTQGLVKAQEDKVKAAKENK